MGSTTYQNVIFGTNNKNVGNVTYSNNHVSGDFQITVSDEKRQILDWLSLMAPRGRHQAVREGRVDGVGNWLLDTNEFQKWHTSEDQAVNPVLLCYGNPGVGKTYLSSLVIDTLCDKFARDNVAVACVYCDFSFQEQSATNVLAALLKQLVAGVEPIPEEIKEAFDRAKRNLDGRALRLPEIRSMLVQSVSSLGRGFICIDALDEFPTKYRPELWGSLQHIVHECPNIRLFITARPHIPEEVKGYFPRYPDLLAIEPPKDDIRGYLTARLKGDLWLDLMDTGLKTDILRIIPDKISGAFLLVSLIMDAVLEGATIPQRRRTLLKMTNGFGLDEAYNTTLDRIRMQGGGRAKLGLGVLMWISCSERLLKTEELCHALAVEVGTSDLDAHNIPLIQTLLGCTLGLVAVDKQASTVRLVHFTLQQHLAAHPNLFTTPHSMMAEICLTYLNFHSVCELSATLRTIPSAMPLLHYASCYWGFHARKEMTKDVKHLALRVLERVQNHISADILLREENVGFLSWWDLSLGKHPDLSGFSGLHCIAYMGTTEIAIEMVNTGRWDLNGRDSNGATPLMWAAKHGNHMLAELLLAQGDVDPTLSDEEGLTPLTHAVKSGHEDVVKLLLRPGGVNPNSPDKYRQTPLSFAAKSGREGMVRLFLGQEGVDPDSSDEDGRTPLSYAAESGSEGVLRALLERRDVNPDSLDANYRTPLSHAARSGHEGIVKILLESRDVNPNSLDACGRTPFSFAARSGHEGVVNILLERRDVDPDSPDEGGRTPLSYAAESGCESVVNLLLGQRDVDPDSLDKGSRTPLSYAAKSGHEGVVKSLLEERRVNPDSSDEGGRTSLSYAAEFGREIVVNLLLERKDVNPNSSGKYGRTPLSYAAGSGSEDVLRALLEQGNANPDSPDTDRRTPLSYAARFGHESVVNLLLGRRDVDPDSLDKGSRTPLSYAAESGREGVVKSLLGGKSVSPDSLDEGGRTPLSYAAESGREGVVNLLLGRSGVNPDSPDKGGRTPLSYAAKSGREGVVKSLLEGKSVSPDSPDEGGRTPLSYAAESGREGVVNLLLGRSDVNPDSSDEGGWTPLRYASESGRAGVVNLLMKRGDVDLDSSERSGQIQRYHTAWSQHLARALSELTIFSHETSQRSSVTQTISVSSLSARE